MAGALNTTEPFTGAQNFTVNGWRPLSGIESSGMFEQAHGLISVINTAMLEDTRDAVGPINGEILAAALQGIETLLSFGMLAAVNEAKLREARMN
jgi:hypothetical protein